MKDFVGFRFGNIHTKDLNLLVVSSSDRYNKNLLPDPTDYTTDVVGSDGTYYFGQTYDKREFSCNIAFDNISEENWRKISQVFSTDKLKDLVFDELPYKTYRAKLSSKPDFNFICFTNRHTGERVYKGEGTLNFICYFPYAFGFNKYIVRAADYYLKTPPERIILTNTIEENPYKKKKQKIYNKNTKEYYNVENNMGTPWKGGYPTIEQVQAGELYFNTPDGEKTIIDVRGYWDNVPEWAKSSKLLTTPTLDYDQELIYLPQYSKTNYINMDTGLNNENALIGSRLLVYNPGDIPIDFELKLDNNERSFWTNRGNHFQIRRYNVQRLPIPAAVDWTGLTTESPIDEDTKKYGDAYFKKPNVLPWSLPNGIIVGRPDPRLLGKAHPKHCYIAEPIPREKLAHYIKLFYWQSSLLKDDSGNPLLEFEEGVEYANRYEELYDLCIDDMERYELYWKTLKEAILNKYKDAAVFQNNTYTHNDFIRDYLYNPPEYITRSKDLYYGQDDFNLSIMPQWVTNDYFDITTDDIKNATLYLDTEKEMLYNIDNPEYKKEDKKTYSNFYTYKPKKTIYNENIKQGHWFKLPPGWSLIEVAPVCDEDLWGGKRWLDARPFDWGYGGDDGKYKNIQQRFNFIYYLAAKEYLLKLKKQITDLNTNAKIDEALKFRHWFDDEIAALPKDDKFGYQLYKRREQQLEYGFLKTLQQYWRVNAAPAMGIKGDINEWWWYACNYIWDLFPPLYWGLADILNKAQIKYTPLFY